MPIRILIADDDSTIRRLLRRLLEDHPDWEVCGEAVNGADAVAKIEHLAPDLAVLDLGMPQMNGLQAAREIYKAHPQIPLILLTVQEVSNQLAEEAESAGFRTRMSSSRLSTLNLVPRPRGTPWYETWEPAGAGDLIASPRVTKVTSLQNYGP